ncbi:MAG: hypothetical protein WBX25_10685 [Rhodomicrobium sp.]
MPLWPCAAEQPVKPNILVDDIGYWNISADTSTATNSLGLEGNLLVIGDCPVYDYKVQFRMIFKN